MTLSLRNRLIRVTIIFCFLFSLFYLFTYFYFIPREKITLDSILSYLNVLEGFNSISSYDALYWSIITAIAFFLFSMISSIFLFHYFKKKISPEIFFFILFILTLSLQSVRMFQLQLILMELSPFYGVIVTRIFYFFRLFSISCLFAASLFPVGVQFQKLGTILISILLLSFTIAALIPIDPTSMNRNFLYDLSDNLSILIMALSIRLLTVVNFIRVAIMTRTKSHTFVMIATLLIVIGDELLLLQQIPILPFVLIFTGTIIYSRSLYTYYLWI